MSWTLHFSCSSDEAHAQLEEKVANVKEGRTVSEKEHIDAAVDLFKHLVPREPGFTVYFQVSGHSNNKSDVSFNSTCSVYKS